MGDKGERTRGRILKAAFALFAQRGYTAVSMQEICERSGMSKGGLYRHFADKGELFAGLLRALQADEAQAEREQMEAGVPAPRILASFLARAQGRLDAAQPGIERALYEYCLENREGAGPGVLEAQYRRGRDVLTALIDYGVRRGELCAPHPQAADAVLFLLEGLQMVSEVMPVPPETARGVCDQIFALLGAGGWRDAACES